jgi:hypothetical protein
MPRIVKSPGDQDCYYLAALFREYGSASRLGNPNGRHCTPTCFLTRLSNSDPTLSELIYRSALLCGARGARKRDEVRAAIAPQSANDLMIAADVRRDELQFDAVAMERDLLGD